MTKRQVNIIAVVGMLGSGKSVVTNLLSARGHPVVHFGNMVYEEVKNRGLDIVKDEVFVRNDMRHQEGPAVMAKRAAIKADELIAGGKDTVIFDGLYSWSEYKYLEKKYGSALKVLAIVLPKKLRRARALKRKDSHRTYKLPDIIKREIDEIENLEKGGPIAYADYYILNDETLENLKAKLKSICQKIGI